MHNTYNIFNLLKISRHHRNGAKFMSKSKILITVLLALGLGLILVLGAWITQVIAPAQPTMTLIPLAEAFATDTPAPQPSRTIPPTWTPTVTPGPSPTPTQLPPTNTPVPPTNTPTLTPSPTATATCTPLPNPLHPPRPTPVVLEVTPTIHPSSTLTLPTAVPIQPIPNDAVTILLLGSDQRPDWDDWHTDAIQYVVVYPDIPSVTMLSIPRDLYVYVPGFWMSRINFADMYGEINQYEGGGLGLFNQTLLYNLGISADYYVKVNFDGLIGIVDSIGGIDVPVHCRLEDYWPYPDENGEYPWLAMQPSIQHMDGELALWYSRSRKTTSVFSREQRQQQVLEAIWRQGKRANLFETIPSLYEQKAYLFQTDLELGTMISLGMAAARLDPVNVSRYNIGRAQVTPYVTPYGGNVFLPVWEEIQPVIADVLSKPAESRAVQAAIPVEVWNGTGHHDWDQLAADRMIHNGYHPILGNSDGQLHGQTQIICFSETSKGTGLNWLQALFNVSSDNISYQTEENTEAKLRLILGQDYNPCP